MIKQLTLLLIFFIPTICNSQVTYNFESGNLTGWTQIPDVHWAASTATPLNGSYSLKHTFNSTASATDRISTALPSWNLNGGGVTWQFKLRHGFDPSSSNRWWVYLMSDQDANQMQLGGTGSGYAIGVNLTGTGDDLLKLWRIDKGVPQAILSSTLNWQTQVTTAGIGAIEVERRIDGTFTLKASTTGSFASLTNYGSIQDITYSDFLNFGVCYSYTSTGDLLLWIDDISLNYNPLNKNDLTSEIKSPSTQIAAGNLNSTSNSSTTAIDVMIFQIKDNATSDALPTKIKSLTIKKASSTNSANWIDAIQGVKLRGESGEVSILNQSISEDKINLTVDSTTFTIPNGLSKEYTLSVYLKPTNIIDGTTLKFLIDSSNHGFNAGLSGSDFANTFAQKIYSNEFKVDVIATNLKVIQSPIGISKNKAFSFSIGGADNAGNIDKEFNNGITLSLSQGSGLLSSPSTLTKVPTLGVSAWNDLQYNSRGAIKIIAISTGVNQVTTDAINVLNDSSSVVTSSASQPAAIAISSLRTYPASAIEVLQFRINDIGDSDGLPTTVKNIKISRAEITDAASLTKAIGGILVKVNGNPVGISQPDIKTNYFTFTVNENGLVAPDGGFVDVSISIFLNESGLTDNQKIQLKVDAINHEFRAYSSGSKFNTSFPLQVISNIFWIDVVASQLKFLSIPTRVGVLQPFNVALGAVDLNGNTDKDFSGSVGISLLTGNGNLTIPSSSTLPIIQGNCSFTSLTYSIPEKFSLLASCPTLNNIASPLITCGDSDGGIAAILSSVDPIIVSSTSTSIQSAVEVIKFNLFDAGTTDGLPLIPSKINLFCFNPTTAELLNRQIGGFVLKANNTNIDIESYSLTNGVFEIIPKAGSLVVADKDTVTLSVSIYLNKTNITDNFSFRLFAPSANHGWLSSSTGTGFVSNFSAAVFGPECSMKVLATNLKFIKVPFSTIPLQQFPVKVSATDSFGNIDIDYTDLLALSLDYGMGTISSININQNLISGNAEWNDVSFDRIGAYRIKVTSNLLGKALSDEIICGMDKSCLIQEDFEGTLNVHWLGSSDWLLSTISPLNGSKSLQQKQSANSGVSTLSIPAVFPPAGDKLIEWNFTIKNGDWDPSSDNYFYFALMANSPDIALGTTSGYFIGINPSSGNDFLTIWQMNNGVKTPIIKSTYDWNPNNEVKIKVGLTTQGEWKLWYMPKTEQSFIFGGAGKSPVNTKMMWCGPVFGYTSSRSGQLWLDDLSICATDYPPVLISATPLNLNTVKVIFSETIDFDNASVKNNYLITDSKGNKIGVTSTTRSADLDNGIFLETEKLPFGKLLLKVDRISDLNRSSIKDSIYFGLGEKGSFGSLIINEVMASPEPSVGLPNYEYIELYNPSSDTISLYGWKMHLNNYTINLPNDSILPHQYAVLSSTTAATVLSTYGKSVGITSFPALLNSGMNLSLIDPSGSLTSLVNYSDSWYGDDFKKNGGWSLEKIDHQNLMEGKENWKASTSTKGGTPCTINSVAAANPDNTSPRLLSFEVVSNKTIKLIFSEPMDSLMLTFQNNYDINNGIGYPVSASLLGKEYNTVMLSLTDPLQSSTEYSLCLNKDISDFSGNHIAAECFAIALPQTPIWNDIVINEVLFNPNTGGVDFVELFNRSDKTVDLSKISIANRNSSTNQIDQVYTATDTAKLLFPNSYAVITISPELVKKFYRTENDKAFIIASKMASFNNDEGYVVLLNNDLDIIDELHYKESMHSRLLSDFKGVSLERINPDLASSNASTWQSAAQTAGFATPTYKNSQWIEPSMKDDAFTLSPQIFSPDGDGRDDYLLISYKLPIDGCIANIRVFSSNGIEVKRLASNLLVGTNGTLSWDGLNSSNQRVPIGIYIVYIEYFNPNGETRKYKKTCVVAEKL